MRTAPGAKPAYRIPVRALLLGIVAVAFAMVGLALLAEAMGSDGGTVYLANVSTGAKGRTIEPVIESTGYGMASAPAESAMLQFLVIRDVPYGADAAAPTTAAGTPTPTTRVGSARGGLSPVISAVEAIGVDEEHIRVVTSPSLISVCNNYSRCSSSRLEITVEQPTLNRLNEIVNAVGKAAAENGMSVQDVGAGYGVGDCRALSRQARELATTDARTRALEQAEVLGVGLGKLLVSMEAGPEQPRDASGCAVFRSTFGDSWWTSGSAGLTAPPFDPTAPPQATVVVEVTLAYAIDAAAAGGLTTED